MGLDKVSVLVFVGGITWNLGLLILWSNLVMRVYSL